MGAALVITITSLIYYVTVSSKQCKQNYCSWWLLVGHITTSTKTKNLLLCLVSLFYFFKPVGGNNYDQSPTPLDGMDVWDTISQGEPSPRKEILLNIDLKNTTKEDELSVTFVEGIAFRMGDMKLLMNVPNATWYKPPELAGEPVKEQDTTKSKVKYHERDYRLHCFVV